MRFCISNSLPGDADPMLAHKSHFEKPRDSRSLEVLRLFMCKRIPWGTCLKCKMCSPQFLVQRISAGVQVSVFYKVLLILRLQGVSRPLFKKGCAGFDLEEASDQGASHSWLHNLLNLWSEITSLTFLGRIPPNCKMGFVLFPLSVSSYFRMVSWDRACWIAYISNTNVSCLATLCNHFQIVWYRDVTTFCLM